VLLAMTAALAVAALWIEERAGRRSSDRAPVSGGVGMTGGTTKAGMASVLGTGTQKTAGGNFVEIHGDIVQVNSPQASSNIPHGESATQSPEGSHRLIRVGDVPMAAAAYQTRPDLVGRLEAAVAGRVAALVALPGQRGAGKTQLAAAMARMRMGERWPVVAWINAETEAGLHAGFEELASELGVRQDGETAVKAAKRVRRHLEDDGERCLLVFDNAEDPRALHPFLPRSGGAQIIITTTRQSFGRLGGATVVDVGGFTPDEASVYLRARTRLDDPNGAAQLAQELGYLPLGLAQASWVISSQRLTYHAYLEKLHRQPVDEVLLRDSADEYQLTVVQAIALALEDLDLRNNTASRRLLELLSLLSSDGVPRRYLADLPHAGFDRAFELPIASLAVRTIPFPALPTSYAVDDALGCLAEASLLLFSEDRSRVIVHRLVARVVRFLSRPWRVELASRARTMLSRPGESGNFSERAWRRWIDPTDMLPDSLMSTQWEKFISALKGGGMQVEWAQVNDLVAQFTALMDNVDDEHWAWRDSAVDWINKFGLESAVEKARERVAELERTVGRRQLVTGYARVHLAYAYWAAGRLDEAIKELKAALPSFRESHGPGHIRTRMIEESIIILRKERDATRKSGN